MNIKEVAKLAGVSVASVSRAFQIPPSPLISVRQRERILKICEELHYYPDINSRRMNCKRSNCITLLSRHISCEQTIGTSMRHFDHNFASITMGIQRVLADCGKSLQLMPVTDEFLRERRHLTMVRSKMTDGILFWGALQNETCVMELLNEDIPMLLLTTSVSGVSCPQVTADEYEGMRQVVRCVLKKGHRCIAILPSPEVGSSGEKRARAVRDELDAAGVTPCYIAPEAGFDYQCGWRMGRKILQEAPGVTCVIAPNDMAAWGCIAAFRKKGVRVPEDISITGADGIFTPDTMRLTSFYLPSYEIGETGAGQLVQWIESGIQPKLPEVLPTPLITGNSVCDLRDHHL